MSKNKIKRENVNTTLNPELWFQLRLISSNMSSYKKQVYINDLLEEGMKYIIEKYSKYLPRDTSYYPESEDNTYKKEA